jgi:sporulation protein YlmC with PRC-barrel domain
MGNYVGHVTDVLIDSDARSVSAIEMKIKERRDKSESGIVLIPYDLIVAAGDIVLIGTKK